MEQGRFLDDSEFEGLIDPNLHRNNPLAYVAHSLRESPEEDESIKLQLDATLAVLGTYARISKDSLDPRTSRLGNTINQCFLQEGKTEEMVFKKDLLQHAVAAIRIELERNQ